jgi:hypothetical protein
LKEINNIDILKLNKIEEYNKTKYDILNLSSKYPHFILNLSSINEDNILKISSINEDKNCCKYCNKNLSNYKNRWRHEKNCKMKNNEEINKDEIIKQKDDQIHELMEMMNKLIKTSKSSQNNNKINGNNNNNNTTNIQINNFESENIDYFGEKIAFKIAEKFKIMVGSFVELLHFNDKHPENHTIRLMDMKSGLGEIKTEKGWTYYDIKNFLNQVLINLRDKLSEMTERISDEKKEKFEDLCILIEDLIDDKYEVKQIKNKIKLASINGTNKIHKINKFV